MYNHLSRPSRGQIASAVLDSVGAVAIATGAVAALDTVAPATGLGVVYLLAVLYVAIRRGEIPALATAILSVLALNYFFIAPVHRLTISDSENVVALGVFLIAAVVVVRLALAARSRAIQAEERAGGEQGNKGSQAARTALEMADAMARLRASVPQ